MTLQDLRIRYFALLRDKDFDGIARLLDGHPELLASPEVAARLMHAAVGDLEVVKLLVTRGVSVNIPKDPQLPDRPIGTATIHGCTDTVRWLIAHGSDINYGWERDKDYCVPLGIAIMEGHFEIVRLLVEAGGYLGVLDRTNRTSLTWAIEYGQHEIAAYLRSKGAVEAREVPGYVPPPPPDPIPEHVATYVGPLRPNSWLPIVPDTNPVPIHAADGDGVVCLFTAGMSNRPQPPGPGGDAYTRAEVGCFLAGWPDDPTDWGDEHLWPVHWLRRLAAYPWQTGTGYGGPVAVVANGDPPAPLGPGTALTCWLLLADKPPLERAYLADGAEVVFYTAVPIHTAEHDYERAHGTEALLTKFAEHEVPDHIDPARPSVV